MVLLKTDYMERMEFMAVAIEKYSPVTLLFSHLAGVFEMVPTPIPTPADWRSLQVFLEGVDAKFSR